MKIALLFSGQPRDIQKGFDSISKFLYKDGNTIDVYAHLWYDKDDPDRLYETSVWASSKPIFLHKNTPELFENLYKPIKVVYEAPPRDEDIIPPSFLTKPRHSSNSRNFYNIRSSHLSLKKTIDLFQSGEDWKSYDLVIKTRTDIIFNILPEFRSLERDRIYCTGDHYAIKLDILLLTSPELLQYINLYDSDEELYIQKNIIFNCEQLLWACLKYTNVFDKVVFLDRSIFSHGIARFL